MTCPSRYLTADGRVLRCGDEGRAHGAHGSSMYACAHQNYDEMADEHGPITSWDEADPCAWDATCAHCGDGRLYHPDAKGWEDCPTCGGSRTVETVPTGLVGIGSQVRHGDRMDGLVNIVRNGRVHVLWWDLGSSWVCLDCERFDPPCAPVRTTWGHDDDGPVHLIRAVPPAHQEDDR